MPGITKEWKTSSPEERTITIRRPTYRGFRNIAQKVAALLEVDPDVAMSAPEFEQVITACTQENLDEWLDEAQYDEVIRLWDDIIEFCEFESFFAERQRRHFESSKERIEREAELQAAQLAVQFKMMKKDGLLPENFSLESVMNEGMNLPEIPTISPSSPTSTPTTTDGPESKSKAKTSGSSSGTTQKQSAAGKRSKS